MLFAGRSFCGSLLARVSIFVFTYIGLLWLTYFVVVAIAAGVRGIAHPFSLVIEAFAALELLWFLVFRLAYAPRLRRPDSRYSPKPLARGQRRTLFHKGLNLVPDLEYYVRRWLGRAHWDDIRRDNVKEWLLHSLFERDGPAVEHDQELDEYVAVLEEQLGFPIKSGYGEAKTLRPTLDELTIRHRSLLYYTVSTPDMIFTANIVIPVTEY